jgi:7-cyano-7-deazaguanine synthase in queuosine biosynthesis
LEGEIMWMNVDYPTKKITFHLDDCIFIPTTGSKYKKVNGLLRDGGWLYFKDLQEAQSYYEDNYKQYKCGNCYSCKDK